MPKKNFSSKDLNVKQNQDSGLTFPSQYPPEKTIVEMPEKCRPLRHCNFGDRYGKGYDEVTYAIQYAIQFVVNSAEATKEETYSFTTASRIYAGCNKFLDFCATLSKEGLRNIQLSDIDDHLIKQFVAYLSESGVKPSSQYAHYNGTKSGLKVLARHGTIDGDIFPKNPFPRSTRNLKGESPLSPTERKSVSKCLSEDLTKIIKSDRELTKKDLSVCLLALALRTGLNPTPLFELRTDCIQPHPLKENRYVLVSYKRRGNNTRVHTLRRASEIEQVTTALPDVAKLIELVKTRNKNLRASSNYPDKLFVYDGGKRRPGIQLFDTPNLTIQVSAWVMRHDLRDLQGMPLKLNISRIRKTFENRVFELSGQDPFLTAKLGGHHIKVSNDHYLEAPKTAERDWALMAEVRSQELLQAGQNLSFIEAQNTPVAKCRDTKRGQFAPKNGEHCQRFLDCFRCKSFVITTEDLHRIYSLYWLLVRERNNMRTSDWSKHYGHIIRVIDNQIAPKFKRKLIAEIRQKAKDKPHPFWADIANLEAAA